MNAEEIRQKIIDVMSVNGGHLASNLGVVELTMALHAVFDSPKDKLIFDTSHQIYAHKLLTGRADRFDTIRKGGGLYGFAAPHESPHDHFYAGHGGTALSLALGCAHARDLTGGDEYIVPIVGDASLTCGLAFEALDNIPKDLKKFIVILNDNEMSISKNVGAVSEILGRLMNNPSSNKLCHDIANFLRKIPNMGEGLAKAGKQLKESLKTLAGSSAPIFEQFNLAYVGPVDGHDLDKLIDVLNEVKDFDKPTIVHVQTVKGYGMQNAEDQPISYHGAKPFDRETGTFIKTSSTPNFSKVFGSHILQMAKQHPQLVAISAATPVGTGLIPFAEKHPDRFFDVGIAEGHAVTFAGAMAYQGKTRPIFNVYATFLQRAFDNIFHDVCIQNWPVIFAIDRAGVATGDGITHHGIYDIGFLTAMPNMIVAQPRDGHMLKELLESAMDWKASTAIRYPNLKTTDPELTIKKRALGQGEVLREGKDIAIIALGTMCQVAMEVREKLKSEGLDVTVVDPIFLKPIDSDLLDRLLLSHSTIITIEEHVHTGGLGNLINNYVVKSDFTHTKVINFTLPDEPIHPGSYAQIMEKCGLDSTSITKEILENTKVTKVTL